MKKFLKLTTVVVSMVMALAFVSCANGNENSNDGQLNLVGTYGLSKFESYLKVPDGEESITMTMPTSTSIHQYVVTQEVDNSEKTTMEMDYTITKTANGYSFNWAKYNINGVAQGEEAKTQQEVQFNDEEWNDITAPFAMTYTTTADGTWSDNSNPASSGTYTVDEANSKVIMKTFIEEGQNLDEPQIMEANYSNNGKTVVFVEEESSVDGAYKMTMTFTRK